ncbi:DUF5347 family protein [Xenorhabdus bovienii]|uniref:DUF5347 family protein n=1 Tax=Xenorhabdus bovienii TaxID=40576 RepID=UPI0004D5D64C|nr:DUF5347 family protein [Xenorhabdus bovienii]CDG86488.1 Phage-related protein [Xenorhabdus bovienii str. feltiae France]CDG90742.1 Phage-related protein [Xenorhabdus bovienii str. feltiae Florida]
MANTESHSAVVLTLDEKIDGMCHTAQIKGTFFDSVSNSDKAISEFIKNMRDRTNNRKRNNKKLLHGLFHLAGLPESRYESQYEDFTSDERRSLKEAMIQLQAAVSWMPKNIAI